MNDVRHVLGTSIVILGREFCEPVLIFANDLLAALSRSFAVKIMTSRVGFGWVVMPVRRGKIEECVEILCHQGCSMVYRYISALQQDEEFPEVEDLSTAERLLVLDELVAIMDIYDGSCES